MSDTINIHIYGHMHGNKCKFIYLSERYTFINISLREIRMPRKIDNDLFKYIYISRYMTNNRVYTIFPQENGSPYLYFLLFIQIPSHIIRNNWNLLLNACPDTNLLNKQWKKREKQRNNWIHMYNTYRFLNDID